ncbi:MAG: TetR/AcrR family transcriptional regulator [Litoreibacter sp.]|nr:TetR/AcrR family transcriptional regulator [Litoreibacter sp.]
MAGKIQKKREDLRRRLIDLAEKRVADGGIQQIRARELAKEAECAVGAIYNVFGDLNELVMAVNGRTFKRLGTYVLEAVNANPDTSPTAVLTTMAHAYLGFAQSNTPAWRTLFDLEMSTEQEVPEWYLFELQQLLALIAKPVAQNFPDLPPGDVELMTRGLFSSIHGIVVLGLEKRISAVPTDELERMISLIINSLSENS